MFNFIDNYTYISVNGCVCMSPSALLCLLGLIMLLRWPCSQYNQLREKLH